MESVIEIVSVSVLYDVDVVESMGVVCSLLVVDSVVDGVVDDEVVGVVDVVDVDVVDVVVVLVVDDVEDDEDLNSS